MTFTLSKPYMEESEGGVLRIAGTRVSLASVVYEYRNGAIPEQIVADYPSLNLEQVYGSIAFYLANRQSIDDYLMERERRIEGENRSMKSKRNDALKRIVEMKDRAAVGS